MSFAVHARRVRDAGLPHAHRRSALRSAVVLYGPFAFEGTWHCLGVAGALDRDGAALERALALLELSRAAAIAERAAFARRRSAEKRAHRRRPSAADVRFFAAPRWPGPDGPRMAAREVERLLAGPGGPPPALPGEPAALRRDLLARLAGYRADRAAVPESAPDLPSARTGAEGGPVAELRSWAVRLRDAGVRFPEVREECRRLARAAEVAAADLGYPAGWAGTDGAGS